MRSSTPVLAVASCMALLGSGGCKPPADPQIALAKIGPDGGVVTSVDSILTIAILPGALEQTIELGIDATDEPPEVYGPAYHVFPNVELAIPASVSYRYPLPDDTSEISVGYVDLEEFSGGQGRWRSLPVADLDPEVGLVTGLDSQLSLFYGLLDGRVILPPETDTDQPTGDGTTGATDPDTGPTTDDPTTGPGPTTGPSETTDGGQTTETDGTTGETIDCDNLPAGPLAFDEFLFTGTPLDGNSEDLTFTAEGGLVLRNGANLVQIDPAGNVANIPLMSALPDTLGLRQTTAGDIVTATFSTGELLRIQPDGTVSQLWGGLGIPNGVYPAIDGNLFFTDFNIPQAAVLDPAGTTITVLGTGGSEAPQANGIIYDPDREFVYYVSYGQGILWRVDVSNLANPGAPQMILTIASEGGGDQVGLDGVAMDACGNLYIVDQNQGAAGSLYRVLLDAAGAPVGGAELLVETFPDGVANAVFGQGPGWEAYETTLFLVGLPGRIFRVDVGVPGAPTAITG